MKRSFEEIDNGEIEKLAMSNCASILLSRLDNKSTGCTFNCKKCKRQFSSFQGLGGHMASHKKRKLMTGDFLNQLAHAVAKNHECSICGLKFGTGQALGGHMRRHRGAVVSHNGQSGSEGSSENVDYFFGDLVPVLKKCNSSKRVVCLDLKLGW